MSHTISGGRLWIFRGILLLFLVALVALAEAAARRWYERLTPESGRLAVASLLGDESAKQTGYFVQHPYLYYAYLPGYEAFGSRQFNAEGYRAVEDTTPVPAAGVLRILTIGGSTTVSFPYARYPWDTWSGQLEKLLTERTGLRVEVVNAGLHDANSADNLLHYVFRDRYLQPAIVVLHAGGNDGVSLLFDHYNPEYTHYTHGWRNTSLAPRPFERQLLRSVLVRVGYAWWLKDASLDAVLGRDDIQSLPPKRCLKNAQANEPEGFRRNLDLLVQNILDDQAVPVIFPFVWAPESVVKDCPDYGPYCQALICAFEKDRKTAVAVAEKHGLATVLIPDGAIDPSFFVDFCHVSPDGEAVKARYVADALMPIIEKLNADGRFEKAELEEKPL